jgi:hypothetical protein
MYRKNRKNLMIHWTHFDLKNQNFLTFQTTLNYLLNQMYHSSHYFL